jgi:hypothetical protein
MSKDISKIILDKTNKYVILWLERGRYEIYDAFNNTTSFGLL